jgi:hypothetical protein
LVFYPQLVQLMREHAGCEPVTAEEAAALKLPGATEMFEKTYDAAAKRGRRYAMSEDIRRFSFLNRWFVFRRRAAVVPRMPTASKAVAEKTPAPSARRTTTVRRTVAPAPIVPQGPGQGQATMMQPPAADTIRTITAVLPSEEEAPKPSTVKKSRRKPRNNDGTK